MQTVIFMLIVAKENTANAMFLNVAVTTLDYSTTSGGNGVPGYILSERLNTSNLKPETTYSWEVGLELSFLNNRIGLDITYYNSESRDQIYDGDPVRWKRFANSLRCRLAVHLSKVDATLPSS